MQDWERKKEEERRGERKATGAQDGEERQLFIEPNARTKKEGCPFQRERQFMILIVERVPLPRCPGGGALLLQAWFRLGTVVASYWPRLYCSRAAKVPPQYYLLLLLSPTTPYFLPLIHPSILLTPSQPSFPSARP